MRTKIITRKAKTTLTIETSEDLYLERVDVTGQQIKLTRGVNHVPVDAGEFRVLSKAPVSVTADAQDVQIVTIASDKDGGPIDPQGAKGQSAPR